MITITIHFHAPPDVRSGLIASIIKNQVNDELSHRHSLIFCQSEVKVRASDRIIFVLGGTCWILCCQFPFGESRPSESAPE